MNVCVQLSSCSPPSRTLLITFKLAHYSAQLAGSALTDYLSKTVVDSARPSTSTVMSGLESSGSGSFGHWSGHGKNLVQLIISISDYGCGHGTAAVGPERAGPNCHRDCDEPPTRTKLKVRVGVGGPETRAGQDGEGCRERAMGGPWAGEGRGIRWVKEVDGGWGSMVT
jgi:hypothetical protein